MVFGDIIFCVYAIQEMAKDLELQIVTPTFYQIYFINIKDYKLIIIDLII